MPSTNPSYALSEAASDDLRDYDVISSGHRSLDSSIAELDPPTAGLQSLSFGDSSDSADYALAFAGGSGNGDGDGSAGREPRPTKAAREEFEWAGVGREEVQAYVSKSLGAGALKSNERPVTVYVDGVFDVLNVPTLLRLRQAKLSFSRVHLLAGVLPTPSLSPITPSPSNLTPSLTARCELLRHVRWVDEVLPDAPTTIDSSFLLRHRIDYVAIEEGASVDPGVGRERVVGYDYVKSIGKAIPTRRTKPASPPLPHGLPRPSFIDRDDTGGDHPTPRSPIMTLADPEGDDPDDGPFVEPKVDEPW
ncbi:hypothetical protein BD410DRAFT_804543 [Rickenella mellea]|uniref:choline-phosphate cytidylyltransferase n=1 Tax=Rickenella mellea TaxID=50990 RepID=A0A4Y7Q0F5_9AGAM|nr:hypothetical protein BD410DRAFT_804543 [Rickenella mellea]